MAQQDTVMAGDGVPSCAVRLLFPSRQWSLMPSPRQRAEIPQVPFITVFVWTSPLVVSSSQVFKAVGRSTDLAWVTELHMCPWFCFGLLKNCWSPQASCFQTIRKSCYRGGGSLLSLRYVENSSIGGNHLKNQCYYRDILPRVCPASS